MADARLGLLRTAPPLAPAGAFDQMPDTSRQLTAISDLTNVVVWELVAPDAGIIWHAPFERLLAGQDPPRHLRRAARRRRQAPLRHRARRSRARSPGPDGPGRE